LLALLTAVTGFLPGARAQDYPNRQVRLMTDSAPGSAIDVPVRLVAEGLSRIWGQQAVVVNQPGAGGAIAARSATTAAPDGYTFGVMALSAFVALPGTADNLPVQVPRDAIPVGYLGGAPMFIGSAPWLGIKTLPDLWPVSGLSQDSSGFFSGNDLYDKCTAESLVCAAYVAGMADALVHDGTVCLPQVSTRQLVDVVMAYLRAHPESRIYSAASIGDVAFTQAFPCVSKRRPPG
jgi:tripartite-type tricarboxylate transporter receptor subunit TctC